MFIYAGIDEAGYGPSFGPMTVGRCVLRIPKLDHDSPPPDLWARLNKAVCRRLSGRKGRLVVNDSKKLKTKAAGIKHLEMGCLAFAALRGGEPESRKAGEQEKSDAPEALDVGSWLDTMGEDSHRSLHGMPWYTVAEVGPWAELPVAADAGELAIARNMLRQTCGRIGVEVADLGCAVVFEDRFNRMTEATKSKAAMSFTFVAGHLQHIWQNYAEHRPTVVIDRQSGRMRYRDVLAMNFPDAEVDVLGESAAHSTYRIQASQGPEAGEMTIHFQTAAEEQHMPVALASMIAKYNRELLMERFQAYFTQKLPQVAPTAGYGSDAKRFWQEVQPQLPGLGIQPHDLRRRV